jgi:predicted DNA-binding protein with PD1-like motif/glutaredoxin
MKPHSLKLSPESDLIKSIKEYSFANNLYGYVSGVVGNLKTVCIQCPGNQEINKFEGNLEIVSLNGHFNKGDVHLHLSFADEGCNVFGGHLEEGCIVKKGTDILLISFEQKIIKISKHDSITNPSRVKAYILKDCPWSKRAIRLLNSLTIPHEVNLIEDDESFQKIMAKSGHNTFPQIFLDNNFFGGYDELSEQARLDNLSSFK